MILIALGYYFVPRLSNRIEVQIFEQKAVRTGVGIVIRKEYVKFDESNHSYQHIDGYPVVRRPGDEEWRVYYQIQSFDGIAEPFRSRLLLAEKDLTANRGRRFTIVSKEQYDKIKVGDELKVSWRWRGDDKVEIVDAGKIVEIIAPSVPVHRQKSEFAENIGFPGWLPI
jgi:uncharacterized protein YaiE (UPF0345 family)